jgi:hypothetical protein
MEANKRKFKKVIFVTLKLVLSLRDGHFLLSLGFRKPRYTTG